MTPAPLLTEDEIQWVKDSIILPVMLDVLRHDIQALTPTKLKLPELYQKKFLSIQKEAARELSSLKQIMEKRGIRIFYEKRTREHVQARYKCRGYEHEMILLWDIVKAEVEIRMSRCLEVNLEDEEEPP